MKFQSSRLREMLLACKRTNTVARKMFQLDTDQKKSSKHQK